MQLQYYAFEIDGCSKPQSMQRLPNLAFFTEKVLPAPLTLFIPRSLDMRSFSP